MPASIPHVSLEIRDTDSRLLVTALEVLSPTNKRSGRAEYLGKREQLLQSQAHLIEIDLLWDGPRMPMRRPIPPCPYCVLVSRADRRPVADVWPVRLDQPLPTIPVPLLPGDADVALNLQVVFDGVYDSFGYSAAIDYSKPPEQALGEGDLAWINARLAGVGKRVES